MNLLLAIYTSSHAISRHVYPTPPISQLWCSQATIGSPEIAGQQTCCRGCGVGGGRSAQLQVEACGRMSGSCEDAFLDKGIENEKIGKWLRIRW